MILTQRDSTHFRNQTTHCCFSSSLSLSREFSGSAEEGTDGKKTERRVASERRRVQHRRTAQYQKKFVLKNGSRRLARAVLSEGMAAGTRDLRSGGRVLGRPVEWGCTVVESRYSAALFNCSMLAARDWICSGGPVGV